MWPQGRPLLSGPEVTASVPTCTLSPLCLSFGSFGSYLCSFLTAVNWRLGGLSCPVSAITLAVSQGTSVCPRVTPGCRALQHTGEGMKCKMSWGPCLCDKWVWEGMLRAGSPGLPQR